MRPLLFAVVAIGLAWVIASALSTDHDRTSSPGGVAGSARGDLVPLPVLLVPGWLDTGRDLDRLEARFVEAGWPPERVRAVTFDDAAGSNRHHAVELDVIARSVLRQTGADSLDIVAFSMGGLGTRWYLRYGDPVPVRKIVFLATPHWGTMAAHLAWGDSRQEMLPESGFLDSLNTGPILPDGVEALTVRTQIDTHVIPEESATLPGVPDRELCCPTHSGLLEDEDAFQIILGFLEGGSS